MGINKKGEDESVFESFVAIFKWIKIFLSPTLLFGLIGFSIYFNANSLTYELLGYLIILLGIVLGIFLAEYVRKKHGIIEFDSRVYSSDDIDESTNHTKKE